MSRRCNLAESVKRLCWEDRLLHNKWKVRYNSNIDLKALCDSVTDPKDHRLEEFGTLFKEMVSDPVVIVQDKALDSLIAYLKAADADVARGYASEICDAVVVNCLADETVSKAQIVFMLWVELEAVDAVLDALGDAITTQLAEAVLPALDVMFQAITEFGSKIVPPSRLLNTLLEIYDHQDQNVRASSKRLTLELCRWIGSDPVKSILFEKLSDTMKKELDAAELANVTVAAKPTRKIRSEQAKQPERRRVSTDPTGSDESALGIYKYKLVDFDDYTGIESVYQEQNKKRKQHHGSQKGFLHFVKAGPGLDVISDNEDLDSWIEEMKVIKSLECKRCGMINCICRPELKIDKHEMAAASSWFSYGAAETWKRRPDPDRWCPPSKKQVLR